MPDETLFQERVVRVAPPDKHFVLLRAADGAFLGIEDGGETATFDHVDDKAVCDRVDDGFRHVARPSFPCTSCRSCIRARVTWHFWQGRCATS